MDHSRHFRGKRITVMGLGLLGRGVGDTEFLARCGAELTVTDLKGPDELEASLSRLRGFPNIRYVLGEHRLEDFRNADIVLKAAGVPMRSPYIDEARRYGVAVEMSSSLFAAIAQIRIVGVTGTRGKSTVTHLIHAILTEAYGGGRVLLGGNVRDVSTLALLDDVKPDDLAVLELDSWQLQGFGDRRLSPHVAVFTTFLDDHRNYYGDDTEQYYADKANIYRYQRPDDVLVAGEQVAPLIQAKPYDQPGRLVTAHAGDVPSGWNVPLPGRHNRVNIACAVHAARALGVPHGGIRRAVERFRGVPGRLELLREPGGVRIYNDNNATTPDATVAALDALADGRNIVLIMGGADKRLDPGELVARVAETCKALVLIPGSGTDLARPLFREHELPVVEVETLDDAVSEALSRAGAGDVVLFSPAYASFGQFRNEYERNDRFVDAVHKLGRQQGWPQ